jgi:hypothetical protein
LKNIIYLEKKKTSSKMGGFFINVFDDILLLDERTNKIRYISNKTSMNYEAKVRSGHNFMVVWNYNYLYHQYIYPLIFVSLGPARGEVYSIQLYVIKIVNNV